MKTLIITTPPLIFGRVYLIKDSGDIYNVSYTGKLTPVVFTEV
jgi:hypothetical protein